jgi:hypothetical protein
MATSVSHKPASFGQHQLLWYQLCAYKAITQKWLSLRAQLQEQSQYGHMPPSAHKQAMGHAVSLISGLSCMELQRLLMRFAISLSFNILSFQHNLLQV